MCLRQAKIWIFEVICHGAFFIQWIELCCDILLCWYGLNIWASLFSLLFIIIKESVYSSIRIGFKLSYILILHYPVWLQLDGYNWFWNISNTEGPPLPELLRNRLSYFDTCSLHSSSINHIVYFKNAVLPAI